MIKIMSNIAAFSVQNTSSEVEIRSPSSVHRINHDSLSFRLAKKWPDLQQTCVGKSWLGRSSIDQVIQFDAEHRDADGS